MPDKIKNNPPETTTPSEPPVREKTKVTKPEYVKKTINWQTLGIYLFLTGTLFIATAIAVYKHTKAITALNKANEIMMTNTGIVIDSVNIKSFQEAEYILSEKQKSVFRPDQVRNLFLYDQKVNTKKNGAVTEPEDEMTDTVTATDTATGIDA